MYSVIVCDLLALGDESLGHDEHVAADVVPVRLEFSNQPSSALCTLGWGTLIIIIPSGVAGATVV